MPDEAPKTSRLAGRRGIVTWERACIAGWTAAATLAGFVARDVATQDDVAAVATELRRANEIQDELIAETVKQLRQHGEMLAGIGTWAEGIRKDVDRNEADIKLLERDG